MVFARSQRPLLEAPLFAAAAPEPDVEAHECPPRPGGWQTLQLTYGVWEYEMLPALVEWTGAPACFADVHDSDVGLVTGLDTEGNRWQAWLNPDTAAEVLLKTPRASTRDFEEAYARKRAEIDAQVPAAAEAACAWATAAGVRAPAERHHIEALLRTGHTFAEDLFMALLDELDFPEARRS